MNKQKQLFDDQYTTKKDGDVDRIKNIDSKLEQLRKEREDRKKELEEKKRKREEERLTFIQNLKHKSLDTDKEEVMIFIAEKPVRSDKRSDIKIEKREDTNIKNSVQNNEELVNYVVDKKKDPIV